MNRVPAWLARAGRRLSPEFHLWPSTYQVGIVVALVSVSAFFIALVTAYAFAIGSRPNRSPIAIPPLLWLSTALLAASSVGLERARAELKHARVDRYRRMARFTLILGSAFLTSQAVAWMRLHSQHIRMRGDPQASMFYLFTGAHAVHLIGGLAWLGYLLTQARTLRASIEPDLRKHRSVAGVAAVYWHFMGLLWLFLFAMLHHWA